MNTNTQTTPEFVDARLTLDVSYYLNGETPAQVIARLKSMCERAIGESLLTGETTAEVDDWSIDVSILPSTSESEALETKITSFMSQRIEDGRLDPEDIPVRLVRYGLMAPDAFISEMCERMSVDDDEAEAQAIVTSSTAPADRVEFEMQIVVACRDDWGAVRTPIFAVSYEPYEYMCNVHIRRAKALARQAGYRGPFFCFEEYDHHAMVSAVQALNLVPQVVAIDITDGIVHSALRCQED